MCHNIILEVLSSRARRANCGNKSNKAVLSYSFKSRLVVTIRRKMNLPVFVILAAIFFEFKRKFLGLL